MITSMKQCCQANLTTLTNEDYKIMAKCKEMVVSDVTCSVWSCMNQLMLIWSWRKLLPDIEEEGLQGVPDE